MARPIEDITPFTLLDYAKYPSAIVWFCGCNMRCGYCYNPEIVHSRGKLTTADALEFLQGRRKLLQGVVLSGGEPTLHNRLHHFAKELKAMEYKIKLDTNGTKPDVISRLLQSDLLDFVSLDFKADKQHFAQVTKMREAEYNNVIQSLQILLLSGIDFEVRTTVHEQIVDAKAVQNIIAKLAALGYDKTYFVQDFLEGPNTLDKLQASAKPYDIVSLVQTANKEGIAIDFRNF
ncbi:MAG: anaerobic ribonucleoside-triphosphate reductase activating protein [Campylobacterota bacterium]